MDWDEFPWLLSRHYWERELWRPKESEFHESARGSCQEYVVPIPQDPMLTVNFIISKKEYFCDITGDRGLLAFFYVSAVFGDTSSKRINGDAFSSDSRIMIGEEKAVN